MELKNSELVCCGYGVVAAEYNKNDYAGVDLRGKTALVLVNDPGLGHEDSTYFKGNTMTYYGRWTYKYEEAARQGAEAILIIHETTMAGYPFFVAASSWKSKRLNLKNAQNNEDKCAMEGWVTLDVAKKMMEVAGLDFAEQIKNAKKPSFKPVSMNLQVSTTLDNNFREDKLRNVVALLPGTTKSDEYIIYSAHWDHLGVGVAVNGDSIYNGAMDNASGTAALLTIAKAFSEAKSKPNRSVIFLFVTAEEQGLLGSAYYAEHPIFPTARTVANINLDGMNPNGPKMKDLTITGFAHSDMDDLARREAEKQQRYILPDQEPEKGFFFRSDHFNFAKVGIPSIFASGGYDHAEKGKEYASQKQKEFTANHYNKPSDQYDPASWDFRSMVQDAELFLQLGCIAVWQPFAVGRAELSGRTAARPGDEHRLRARHCGREGRGRGGGRCGLGGLCVLGACLADRRCASRAVGWQGLGAALQDQIPENPRFPFLFSFPLPFHTEPSA